MTKTAVRILNPTDVAEILRSDQTAVLIDVRSEVEFDYVGHPVNSSNIPWKYLPENSLNLDFVRDVQKLLERTGGDRPDRPIFVICRSGARSASAADKLAQAGYTNLTNVQEGFEGEIDRNGHRGRINGWRFRRLPWRQN
jgi:rhodanese-related sulfurtransferase